MGIIIDTGSSVTLQQQIKNELLREIREGKFKPGQKIYTEQQLRDLTGISLVTIKAALADLVTDGVLIRKQGKGTYIKENAIKIEQPADKIYSFIKDYSRLGYDATSTVLEMKVAPAEEYDISSELDMEKHDKVLRMVRIMSLNGEPIEVETTYLPYKYYEGIEKYDFNKVALYEVMQKKYGVDIYRAKETIEPMVLNKFQAENLDAKKGKPALHVNRTSYDANGKIVEFTSAIIHGDKYKYTFELVKKDG